MKRLVIVAVPAILLVVSVLLGLSDKDIPVADTSIPNDQATSSVSSSSSSSAVITITMYAVDNE